MVPEPEAAAYYLAGERPVPVCGLIGETLTEAADCMADTLAVRKYLAFTT